MANRYTHKQGEIRLVLSERLRYPVLGSSVENRFYRATFITTPELLNFLQDWWPNMTLGDLRELLELDTFKQGFFQKFKTDSYKILIPLPPGAENVRAEGPSARFLGWRKQKRRNGTCPRCGHAVEDTRRHGGNTRHTGEDCQVNRIKDVLDA